MEMLARWMWRRWRRHWTGALVASTLLMSTVVVLVPSVIVAAAFFEMERAATLAFLGEATLLNAVVTGASFAVGGRSFLRPLQAWGRGDQSDPGRVQTASFELPRRSPARVSPILAPAFVVYLAYAVPVLIGGSWAAFVAIMVGLLGVFAATTVVLSVSSELLLRPLREEVDAVLGPDSAVPPHGVGVRARISAGLGTIGWGTGFLTAAVAVRFDSPAGRLGSAALAALAFGAFLVAIVAGPTVVAPVLRPLDDLLRGTRRVARGEYGVRLTLTTDDEFGELVQSFNAMQAGLLERERLHAAFGSYVDPALAQRLLSQGDDLFDGEEVEVTVFFADVRDFTPYAEQATPREAVERLNALFALVVPVLRDHQGHANKFLGDGVLAVFGVPELVADHADHALAAALEIQARVRSTFGDSMRLGIGINTGRVLAGTVGGGGKLEFTLIGDAVNVAARVEQVTKQTGDPILLTQATRDALGAGGPALQPRGSFTLKGKAAATALFAVPS
jgi:class 3 adenylate cyclase